jgi:ankyrin repeat protein
MKFAIKKPTAWLWKTDLSKEEIEQRLAGGKITGEWLVCPQGDVNLAVEVSKFLAEPTVFDATPASEAVTQVAPPPLPTTETPPTPNIPRRHDLDALRATAMLLGVVLHAALAYVTYPFWPVRDTDTSAFFDVMNSALHGFRMPLFFMISGFFTAMLWRKRGLGALMKHRAKRILLPLVVLLIPIQVVSFGMMAVFANVALTATTPEGKLCLAAKDNDVATMKQMLDEGVKPNAVEPSLKLPALNWAALNGSHEAAELLLQNGARVDIRTDDQSTPLGHAAFMGHAELAELLLEHGADVNAVNQHDATPLDSTKAPDTLTRMVAGMLKLKVNYDQLPKMREATAKLLVEHGGRSAGELEKKPEPAPAEKESATDAEGPPVNDAFCQAARTNDVETVKRLLDQGVDPSSMTGLKHSALTMAAGNGSYETAELLLRRGADVDGWQGGEEYSPPLLMAAGPGRSNIVTLLLDNGADVNLRNDNNHTALDATKIDEEYLRKVAGFYQLEVDYENLLENQKAVIKILKDHGAVYGSELGKKPKQAKKIDTRPLTEKYREFISWPGFQQPMIFGHLWFLYFLCLILVPFAVWAFIAEENRLSGLPAWMLRSPGVLLWLVPLTMIPQWFNGLLIPNFGPDTSLTLTPFPHLLVLYAVYFFVGAFYFDREEAEQPLGRFWWILMPLALLVVFPIGLTAIHEPESLTAYLPESSIRFVAVFAQSLYAWLMIFGMIGLFKKICAKENKTVRFISDSSYWLYLAHIPVLFAVQGLLLSLDVSAFIKMPLVCLITAGILLLSYKIMVRYTWLGRMLNGKRSREADSEPSTI